MATAYVNSLRDTGAVTALTDALTDALAKQAVTVIVPTDIDARGVQAQQTRLLRRLLWAAQMVVGDEIPDVDEED